MLQRRAARDKRRGFSIRKEDRNNLFALGQDRRSFIAFIIDETYLVKLALDNDQHKGFISIDGKVDYSAIFEYLSDQAVFAFHLSVRKDSFRIASIGMYRNQPSAIHKVDVVSKMKLWAFLGTGACGRLRQLNNFLAESRIHNTQVTNISNGVRSKLGEEAVACKGNRLTIGIQNGFTLGRLIRCQLNEASTILRVHHKQVR